MKLKELKEFLNNLGDDDLLDVEYNGKHLKIIKVDDTTNVGVFRLVTRDYKDNESIFDDWLIDKKKEN